MRRAAAVALATALATTGVTMTACAAQGDAGGRPGTATSDRLREVMFVGNNWEGTAPVVDAATYRPITTIDTIPDRAERMAEILGSPDRLAFYLAIQQGVGEGHSMTIR
jgi:hypothetical protein